MKSERISPFWVNGYQPFSADSEIEYTVQALKDYCHKNKLTIHAVPYLEFTD